MSAQRRKTWSGAAVIALVLLGIYPLQMRIDAELKPVQQEKEELLLRSPRLLHALSLGYESFVADMYWTRVVQYYGGKRRDHDSNFVLLDSLLNITTVLDPHLLVAYKFGGIFLAQKAPQGAARPDLAVKLLYHGIAANPEEWRLWADLGFIYYWDMHDYKKAAEAYLQGSRHAGAAIWMKPMAAQLAAEGGSRQVSVFLWSEIYSTTSNELIRKNALGHLQALKAEDDAEHLDRVIADFKERFGRLPNSLEELVSVGLLPGVPVDPAGFPYVLGAGGKAVVDAGSPVNAEMMKPSPLPGPNN